MFAVLHLRQPKSAADERNASVSLDGWLPCAVCHPAAWPVAPLAAHLGIAGVFEAVAGPLLSQELHPLASGQRCKGAVPCAWCAVHSKAALGHNHMAVADAGAHAAGVVVAAAAGGDT